MQLFNAPPLMLKEGKRKGSPLVDVVFQKVLETPLIWIFLMQCMPTICFFLHINLEWTFRGCLTMPPRRICWKQGAGYFSRVLDRRQTLASQYKQKMRVKPRPFLHQASVRLPADEIENRCQDPWFKSSSLSLSVFSFVLPCRLQTAY